MTESLITGASQGHEPPSRYEPVPGAVGWKTGEAEIQMDVETAGQGIEIAVVGTAVVVGGGAAARVGPPLVRAGAAAAERVAIRGMTFVLDPKAGFFKGLGVGIANQLLFEGEGPIREVPGNKAFNFGLSVGNTIAAPVNLLLRLTGVGL